MVRGRFTRGVREAEMRQAILYVHGMGGNASEAENFGCTGFDVIGVDYEGYIPRNVKVQVRAAYDEMHRHYERVYLLANSIGAYFAMLALQGCEIAKAMFISPILDMERVILDMMKSANVSEHELREKGEIDSLSWEYLCFVRDNPINWDIPTEILYAGRDNITSRQTIDEFIRTHDAELTVMENGEHWFHTDEQMAFLKGWLMKCTQE